MPLKTLVINPWVADFKLYDEWMHPVGLYFLISFLRHNNADVYYFDCLEHGDDEKAKSNGTGTFPSREYPKPELYKNIKRRYKLYGRPAVDLEKYLLSIPCPDIIFVGSVMTYWIAGVKETVDVIRRAFPGVTCIVGGIAASLMPDAVQSILGPVCIFTGSLFDNNALTACTAPVLRTMAALPKHASILPGLMRIGHARHGPALTSLGCPLSCTFCASKALQGIWRPRPPDIVAAEVDYCVSRLAVRHAAFYDDALLYKPDEHLLPFLKVLHDRGISVNFHTPNGMHVRWVTPQVLDTMITSGFSTLRLGYESGLQKQRPHTAGKATFDELAKKVSLMRRAGFRACDIGVYIMAGLPHSTPQDVVPELDAVAQLGVNVKPVFLSPVPKTALFEYYAKQFPDMTHDPLWHNDSFFITRLSGWDAGSVQEIMDRAKKHNAATITPARGVS